jgi:ribosome-associated protein
MISINENLSIDEKEISYRFSRSGGKGGQNVNKVETKVELMFDLKQNTTLPWDVRERLAKLAGKKISGEGVLSITSEETRTQEQNRELALSKLMELLRKAAVKPKYRRKTKPSRSSKEKRLDGKKKDSAKKSGRGRPSRED